MGGVVNAIKDVGKTLAGGFLLGKPSGLAALVNPAGALGLLGRKLMPKTDPIRQESGRLNDLSVQSSAYGAHLAIVLAPWRRAGDIIWATPKKQTTNTNTETISGGKGGLFGGGEQQVVTTNYTYSVSMAIALADCRDGPIAGVPMVWANGELIYNVGSAANYETFVSSISQLKSLRIYTGTTTQLADPLIVATEGSSPAYRTTALAVVEDLQLEKWGNNVPNLEWLVVPAGTNTATLSYLDTASQLGTNAIGSIVPDGRLIVVHDAPSGNNEVHVRHPFTLASLQKFSLAFNPTALRPPVMNSAGDAFIEPYYIRAGAAPVQVGISHHITPEVDAAGNIYVACRITNTPADVYGVVRLGSDGTSTTLTTYPSEAVGLALDHAGSLYVSWLGFGANSGVRQLSAATGATIRELTGSGTAAYRLAVAGDGSVWFTTNTDRNVFRRSADFTTLTQIISDGGFNNTDPRAQLARDWRDGGIVYFALGQVRKYSATGTLLSTTLGTGVDTYAAATFPTFPQQIYGWSTYPLGASQHCSVWRDVSLSTSPVTVGAAISRVCLRAGLTAGEIDVTGATDVLGGYAIEAPMTARAALEPLLAAFHLQVVDTGAKLSFVKRGGAPVLTIGVDDLMMMTSGQYDTVLSEDAEELELPSEVVVRYRDTTRNYLADAQYERRLVTGSRNQDTVDLQIGMTPTQARQLAAVRLFDAHAGRRIRQWALSRKYSRLVPGDVVNLPVRGVSRSVLITKIVSEAGLLRCEGRDDESIVFSQVAGGNAGAAQSGTVGAPSPTLLHLLDVPLLRDVDDDHGIYAGAAGIYSGWAGSKVFKSTDGGVVYSDTEVPLTSVAAVGTASSALGTFAGGNIFDELNVLDVVMASGTMASITRDQAQAGVDDIVIGNEVVGCRSRVLIAAQTYRLSGLLRGRYGTEWAMGQHVAGERVVVINSSAIRNIPLPATDLDVDRLWKGVSFGALLQAAAPVSQRYKGERLRPRAPVLLGGGRNAAGDIVMKWRRAARRSTAWTNTIDVPLDETSEQYRVRVFAGTALAITGITAAANAELTVTGSPLPTVGAWVYLHSVGGMAQLNERSFQVVAVTAVNKFTINEDTTNFTAWTSGGSVVKLVPSGSVDVSAAAVTYTGAQQTTDFGGTQASVRVSVRQISARVGEGRERTAII